MKKSILILLISFAFFHQVSYACTCGSVASFCQGKIDSVGNISSNYLFFRGNVTTIATDTGVELRVDHVLYGNISESNLIIPPRPALCSLDIHLLEEGSDYIFSLYKLEDELFFVPCQMNFLKIKNEIVIGKIAPGIESIAYSDFGTLEGCGSQFNFFSIEKSLSVFPNPTAGLLNIKNDDTFQSTENIQVQFIDALGREVYTFKKEEGILAGESWTINIQHFSIGVYYLKLIANDQENVIKIVKL